MAAGFPWGILFRMMDADSLSHSDQMSIYRVCKVVDYKFHTESKDRADERREQEKKRREFRESMTEK